MKKHFGDLILMIATAFYLFLELVLFILPASLLNLVLLKLLILMQVFSVLICCEYQSVNLKDLTFFQKLAINISDTIYIEATSHVKNKLAGHSAFYQKKYDEVKTHQYKRSLTLTAHKFIRLIFRFLAKHQLYSTNRVSRI